MTVYIDTLFFTNFFMDALILLSVEIFAKPHTPLYKFLIANTFLSLYGTGIILNKLSFLYHPIFIIITPFIIVFFIAKKNTYIKSVVVFWSSVFIMGGILYFLSASNSPIIVSYTAIANGVLSIDFSLLFTLPASIILYIILYFLKLTAVKNFSKDKIILKITVTYLSKEYRLKCLIDTGCNLTEPLSNMPMIIAQKNIFYDLPPINTKVYTNTVGGTACLPFILPSCVNTDNKNYSINKLTPVALVNQNISSYGLYDAIVNPDALTALDKGIKPAYAENL